jgi:hypothetical protein
MFMFIKKVRLYWLILRIVKRAVKNDDLVRLNWHQTEMERDLGIERPNPLPSGEEMLQDLKKNRLFWMLYRLSSWLG